MDFHRANRNLRLVVANADDEQVIGSSDSVDMAGTQIPGSEGFLDGSDQDDDDQIFINTQVQGRLDEAEQVDKVRASLTQFKYAQGEQSSTPKSEAVPQRISTRPLKRTTQRARKGPTKAQSLLEQLSGKHAKIQDMMKCQKKLDSTVALQERTRHTKSKCSKIKTRSEHRYDTYNEDEWQQISKLLLERFPHTEPADVKGVYQYLYGEIEEQTLWAASQLHLEFPSQELDFFPVRDDSQRVSVLSLSQVMNDSHPPEGQSSGQEAEDDSTVPDSTEEHSTIIPIEPVAQMQLHDIAPPLDTPNTLQPDGIIGLTQESFKVVKSLISPLKQENGMQVQVPATRLPTLGDPADPTPSPSSAPLLAPPREQPLRYRLHRSQLKECSAIEGLIVHSLEGTPVPDTESDTSSSQETCIVELVPSILTSKTPSPSRQSSLDSQSAQQLRQSMKSIGLKTSRSKQQMLQSLQAASQILEISSTGQKKKQEIHNYLTSLLRSCPILLEKVYTFQPIHSRELLTRLVETNPFVEAIDEVTIREWADGQGICLRNS